MADTLFSYPNLPLGMNMYHLQVELRAVPHHLHANISAIDEFSTSKSFHGR